MSNTRVQEVAINIGKSGCLALCYIKLTALKLDKEIDPLSLLVSKYNTLVDKGIMDPDCYINNASLFIKECFPNEVKNPLVSKLDEYYKKDPIIAYNGKHFVIVQNGEIIWNSLDNDEAWKKLPTKSYRQVIL